MLAANRTRSVSCASSDFPSGLFGHARRLPAQSATEMILPPAGSLNRSTRICLLNHGWRMLCRNTHQSLRQRRICFGLGLRIVILLLWPGKFCCIVSDAYKLIPHQYLLDAM